MYDKFSYSLYMGMLSSITHPYIKDSILICLLFAERECSTTSLIVEVLSIELL